MTGILQHRHAVRRKSRLNDALPQSRRNGSSRTARLSAAPQNAGVSALEGESRRVGGHVGTGLVNDGYHPHRNRALLYAQTVGTGYRFQRQTHRVGQSGGLTNAVRHGGDSFLVQGQAVQHYLRNIVPRRFNVQGVFLQNSFPLIFQRVRHVVQSLISLRFRRTQEGLGGRSGGAELFHSGHVPLSFAINLVPTGSPAAIL